MDNQTIKLESFYKPDWRPLDRSGCKNVEVKVLVYEENHFAMSLLRFAPDGEIDEHPGDSRAEVFCLEGNGFVSVGDARSAFEPGQKAFWPKGVNHKLWTQDDEMQVLIVHRDHEIDKL